MKHTLAQIETDALRLKVSNYGARLISLEFNCLGEWAPVVAGFEDVARYEEPDFQYFGATVGRVAGRLAQGKYEMDGLNLELETNEHGNHLHGGIQGAIHNRLWKIDSSSKSEISMSLISEHLSGGYPGRLKIQATYRVSGSTLTMLLDAQSDLPTPVSLTNHSYWNLSGNSAPASSHQLQINSSGVIPVDNWLLPTGEAKGEDDTVFDFRTLREIGEAGSASNEPKPGFDHTYLLSKKEDLDVAAILRHQDSRIEMRVSTNAPALQFYSGNRNPHSPASMGMMIDQGNTVCLEAFGVNSPKLVKGHKSITITPEQPFRREITHEFRRYD